MRTALLVAFVLLLTAVAAFCGEVTVTYYGHSCFTLASEGGPTIMIDPYGSYVPYPGLPAEADIVLMTHKHVDHCPPCHGEMDRVLGDPLYVLALKADGSVMAGNWKITDAFSTRILAASHENARGGGAGLVGIFRFEIDGIVFAHLGDLGTLLDAAQVAALRDVEVVFLPVGKQFTLDAAEAMTVIAQLPAVKVVFPIHYYVQGITPWSGMAPLSDFTALAGLMYPVTRIDDDSVTLDADDLPASLEVWLLNYVE